MCRRNNMMRSASNWKQLCMALLLLNLTDYFAKSESVRENDRKELDWWKTAVIYQIYPRSFKDSNGDGIGDLKGIEEKAEHFKDLGVDCVWLSPIFKSPMADFGYDISDYKDVDSIFGTKNDLISLKKKLNSLGIKIILDFVPNHSSDEHEWFKKSVQRVDPYTDYYTWKDAKIDKDGNRSPPCNWQSLFSNSAWTYNEQRGQYYFHQFDPKQPDLNYRNKNVVEEMKNVLRHWLDLGLDGYRVDAVPFLFENLKLEDEPRKPEILASKEKNTYYQYEHPYTMDLDETYNMIFQFVDVLNEYTLKDGKTRLMTTEGYTTLENVMKYYGNASSGVHLPFNFGLLEKLNYKSNATDFNRTINAWLEKMPAGKTANWVIGNHDSNRVANRMGIEMVDAMNMLNLLLPGASFTYMGEEIGMENANLTWDQTVDPQGRNAGPDHYRAMSRDPCRSPYQWDASAHAGFSSGPNTWLPVGSNYTRLNLEAQKKQQRSHYNVYKRLTALKKTRTVRHGAFADQVVSDWVYSFIRSLSDADTYLVVMNVGSEEEFVDLSRLSITEIKDWIVDTPSGNSKYSIGDAVNNSLLLSPKSALVLINKGKDSRSSSPSLIYPSTMLLTALGFIVISRYGSLSF